MDSSIFDCSARLREGGAMPIFRKENERSERTMVCGVAFLFLSPFGNHLYRSGLASLSIYPSIHQRFIERLLCAKHYSRFLGFSRGQNIGPCSGDACILTGGGAETGNKQ